VGLNARRQDDHPDGPSQRGGSGGVGDGGSTNLVLHLLAIAREAG
jgi:hypothetical protein